ncbi:hypothetical protein SAMN04487996_120106 [Dyadobacter soli]|uniref:DoxX-like family protein n=1 Tax=Dyadobacter soli TaxID=659014 RepID=A0A1G7VKH2_9BACT|nr:hypothetical protein [Dyadobacter soli]SDG60187.1 hypothetical protein SAMN04487996_120106 [Dyadobacter soli]
MTIKIISGILILVTVYFGITHGSRAFQKPSPQYLEMMTSLGITDTMRLVIGAVSIGSAILILFPQTFFVGNTIRALMLVLMMAFALKAGNYKFALIEIPFVMMPLALIYLGHPLAREVQ